MHSDQPFSSLSDLEIINRFKKTGNLEYTGVLFTRYTALVYGVCLKYLKHREEAQDATMNIFERLITLLQEHDIGYFKGWLYATTRNHCLMILRSRKGKESEELPLNLMEIPHALHQEDATELEGNLVKLEMCMKQLKDEQQQCVRLFFLDHQSYQQICAQTGFSLNQVKSYIQNGKRNLKICMERDD